MPAKLSRPSSRPAPGFTLIELMIVIAILGILAVALLPNLGTAEDSADDANTRATMTRLQTGCETFARKWGFYPPDDLKPKTKDHEKTAAAWKPDNGTNTSSESLVAWLSQSRSDGEDFSDSAGLLTNTDKDEHGAELPLLKRKDRPEIADSWKVPFAYFSKTTTTLGFDVEQQILPQQDASPIPAKALRLDTGSYAGSGKFQILSAGKDGVFNTDDDVCWPPRT